ncbi:sensor histidine kinase [Paenibacillus luteus]|uniref:sensor histidine kinase n=1 Tax=Paenibacillus luteus TaxID=2545753 RepID=UPI001F4F6ABD|nr:sensor histidine kinase [Paenibacillus luteus]
MKDTGSRNPEDEQAKLFERFYRGTNKQLEVRGLGLGLTFSQMLTNAMGGKLALEESSPQGTAFQLLLPKA